MLKNLPKKLPDIAKGIPVPVSMAADAFNNLVNAWKDCKNTAEIEKTKRENIKSWRDINVKSIEENSAILKLYLELSFKERAKMIEGTFERLDRALENKDTEAFGLMMNAIVDIVKVSPLAQARQLIGDINNPNVNLIEI